MKKSLLGEDRESESILNNETSESLLAGGAKLTESQLKEAVKRFMKCLHENDMKIFKIEVYPIKDKESRIRRSTFKAFALKEINVNKIDFEKNPGFVAVDNGVNIPLVNTDESPKFVYDKEEALSIVIASNKIEWDAIKKEKEEFDNAYEFMKDIVENERF